MRRIYDPQNGSDVTATVQSFLQSGTKLVSSYLYSFSCVNFWDSNPYGNYASFCFTDAEAPLFLKYAQLTPNGASQLGCWGGNPATLHPTGLTFIADNISHDKLSYGIGFEDKPVEITWGLKSATRPYSALMYNTGSSAQYWSAISDASYPVGLTLKQALAMGLFTEAPFWIHSAIFTDFPRLGGTFLGTALMFRGFIRKTAATASQMKISLASLLDVFQSVQIPTQTITPNNRTLPYIPVAVSPYADTGSDYISPVFVNPIQLQITTSQAIPAGYLQDCFLSFNPQGYAGFSIFKSGYPTSPTFRIQGNTAGPGTIQIYFYEPYVYPQTASGFNLYQQQTTAGGPIAGFLYLPPPEFSA